jgi:hypothetical protein
VAAARGVACDASEKEMRALPASPLNPSCYDGKRFAAMLVAAA